MKKIPMRMCVVTRERLPKKELIRVVAYENKVSIDLTGKQNGKGVYLKREKEVIETARKRQILENAFEITVDPQIYEDLLKII